MHRAPNDDTAAPPALAALYDDHYYRTYANNGSLPLGRSELWLSVFGTIADGIVREIGPKTALDVGCAFGMLVEALRDRGVEAYGSDFSDYAIEQVREDVKPYCWVASILDPPARRYDLVTCIEVLEHLRPEDAERAV